MHTLVEMNAGSGQGTHVPAFLAKLWKLVDDSATNDLIYWSEPGNSFVIRNQAKFSRELLPLYYKHNNMASFVRQLNMYGFHKVVSVEQGGLKLEKDEMEFAHPFFLKGNESSLELIKRKIPAPKHDDSRIRPDNLQKVGQVLLDVRQMKNRQESMDSKLVTMKRENEALWRELAALRQKHVNQTTILSKILQFLVGVMSSRSHRLGFKRRMPLMLNEADETKGKTRRHDSPTQIASTTGPTIHDVTELLEDSDELGEGTSSAEYTGGSDPIPNVDSPIASDSSNLGIESMKDDLANNLGSVDEHSELKDEFGNHLEDMELGLNNLRDSLKSDEYKFDNSTLLGVSWPSSSSTNSDKLSQLFGNTGLNLDLSKFNDVNIGTEVALPSSQELVSYNPSLFELTEDDSHFFDDSSNMFLDDELQSMLTTDRDKLGQGPPSPSKASLFTNADLINTTLEMIENNNGLSTPRVPSPVSSSSKQSASSTRK